MKEMMKLALLIVPLAILVCYSWLFVLPYYSYDDPLNRAPGPYVLGTIWAIGVTVASMVIVLRQYRSIRLGARLYDERSRGIVMQAGYYSFWISIGWWFLLCFVILSDTGAFGLFLMEKAPEALVGGLLALPAIFFIVWSYLTYRYRPGPG